MHLGFDTRNPLCVPRSDAQRGFGICPGVCPAHPILVRKRAFERNLLLLPVLLLEVGVNIHACGNRAEQEHDDRQRGRTVVGQIFVELDRKSVV